MLSRFFIRPSYIACQCSRTVPTRIAAYRVSAWKSRGSDHFLIGSASEFEYFIDVRFGNFWEKSLIKFSDPLRISSASFPFPFRWNVMISIGHLRGFSLQLLRTPQQNGCFFSSLNNPAGPRSFKALLSENCRSAALMPSLIPLT